MPHSVSPRRDYEGLELTSRKLQSDWSLARWEWWKPIWEVFFIEGNEFPPFDDVTFPKKDLRDNPDWRLPRVQLLSFEELGCAISNYNKHWLYPDKCFACKCESDDDSELLGSSDWEDYSSTAGDDL